MTSSQDDRDARLHQIMEELKSADCDIDALVAEAILLCGQDRLRPPEWTVMQHYRDGFDTQIGIDYYLKAPLDNHDRGYMPYRGMPGRQRPGKLVVLLPDGTQKDVAHELAMREEFFIGAPIKQLQLLARQPGDEVVIELPDLTAYIGNEEGGTIALVLERNHVVQIVDGARNGLRALIDLAITPGRREALEAAAKKPRGL